MFVFSPTPDDAMRGPSHRIGCAFVAAAAGDALGWPYEHNNQRIRRPRGAAADLPSGGFEAWTRKVGGRFYASEEPIGAGEYSDDTQLLVATARSIQRAGDHWAAHFLHAEIPAWLMYERGGGGATKRAARSWAKGTPPWADGNESDVRRYYDAGGNGVAMRVLPHAFSASNDLRRLRRDVLLNGTATHGHPRALVGGLLYVAAAYAAAQKSGGWSLGELIDLVQDLATVWRRTPTPDEFPREWLTGRYRPTSDEYRKVWETTVAEVDDGFSTIRTGLRRGALAIDDDVLRELGAFDKARSGAGTVTTLSALYLASRYAADPATGVRTAAYAEGADTDTLASMTAGLLGAMLGEGWLPREWSGVQDAEFLRALASKMVSPGSLEPTPSLFHQPSKSWTESDGRQFKQALQDAGTLNLSFGPLGSVSVVEPKPLQAIAKNVAATRWQLRTEDGQTIFILVLSRETAKASASSKRAEADVEDVRRPDSYPDRIFTEVAALTDTIGASFPAVDLLRALRIVMQSIWDQVGPEGNRTQLPERSELQEWLKHAVKAHQMPELPDEALLSLARVAWRINYGQGRVRHGSAVGEASKPNRSAVGDTRS